MGNGDLSMNEFSLKLTEVEKTALIEALDYTLRGNGLNVAEMIVPLAKKVQYAELIIVEPAEVQK